MRRTILVGLAALSASSCYHVNVSTGVAPGTSRYEEKWAPGWIAGLVSPDPVNGQSECGSSGVARVESRISFLNGLVSILTANIFTPMEITVTCGQGEEEQDLQDFGDAAGLQTEPDGTLAAR